MGNMTEYVKMAFKNIIANKGRSFLTMLGIIIGIASVIMVMSVGDRNIPVAGHCQRLEKQQSEYRCKNSRG